MQAIGFSPARTALAAAGLSVALPVAMTATAQPALESVVVTATRIEQRLEDVPATVTVIDADMIARQIAEDLDDLIRYEPGIAVDTAGRGGNQGFVIRGIGGNRVLTVSDGVRSSDQYAAGPASYGKDVYELDDLKSVEIIRGPASVLYGADAVGGAVLLRTKDAADYVADGRAPYVGARVSYAGANDLGKVGVTGAVSRERYGLLAQLTSRRYAEYETDTPGARNPLDGESHALLLKASLEGLDRHELVVAIDMLTETVDTALESDLGDSVTASSGRDETDRHRVSITDRWTPRAPLLDEIESQIYWQTSEALQHTRQTRTSFSFIDPFDPSSYAGTAAERVSDFRFDQIVRGVSLTARRETDRPAQRHRLVFGLNAETTDTERPRDRCETAVAGGATTCSIAEYPFADPEVFPNRTFPDTRTRREGVFVQDEIGLGRQRRVTLVPGVRYDSYRMDPRSTVQLDVGAFDVTVTDEQNVSTNFGLLVDMTDSLAFVMQYAEGFRPPNFDESNQAFVNRAFGYATVPNPDLRPEDSRGLELGVRGGGERVRFGVTAFRNDYRDFIASAFVGMADGISLFQDRNIDRARIEGAEMTARWLLTERWSLNSALAYARGDNERTGQALDSVEPLTVVVGASFEAPGERWGLDVVATRVDDKDRVSADDRVTADGYTLVDLIARFRPGRRTTLRAGIYNLFDEDYARWANIQGLPANDAEAIARAQAPGANARLSIRFDF